MKTRRYQRIGVVLCALCVLLSASGCNTIRGFGKDLSKVGDELEEAASR